MNFEKLNAGFNDLPIVTGAKVFTSSEYAAAVDIQPRTVRERLQKLLVEQRVRKVRTRRGGRIVPAWEYLSGKRRPASE